VDVDVVAEARNLVREVLEVVGVDPRLVGVQVSLTVRMARGGRLVGQRDEGGDDPSADPDDDKHHQPRLETLDHSDRLFLLIKPAGIIRAYARRGVPP
jgi:hypothetical protein